MQTSSGSLDIDAEENFSIAHCEEHPSRRRLADGEGDVPVLTAQEIIARQPDEELEPYQASKKGSIPNGSRLFKNRRGIQYDNSNLFQSRASSGGSSSLETVSLECSE